MEGTAFMIPARSCAGTNSVGLRGRSVFVAPGAPAFGCTVAHRVKWVLGTEPLRFRLSRLHNRLERHPADLFGLAL